MTEWKKSYCPSALLTYCLMIKKGWKNEKTEKCNNLHGGGGGRLSRFYKVNAYSRTT